jgi:hypothetical protein
MHQYWVVEIDTVSHYPVFMYIVQSALHVFLLFTYAVDNTRLLNDRILIVSIFPTEKQIIVEHFIKAIIELQ